MPGGSIVDGSVSVVVGSVGVVVGSVGAVVGSVGVVVSSADVVGTFTVLVSFAEKQHFSYWLCCGYQLSFCEGLLFQAMVLVLTGCLILVLWF